jgi:hypothetical protein
MSEYQFYEFLALDRPLSAKDMAALRQITSRAEITPTRLCNVYHYGDFRGDPRALMMKYFDAMVYVTNWGTRQLMLKVPRAALALADVAPYRVEDVVETVVNEQHLLLDLQWNDEEGGEWIEDEEAQDWLSSIVPIRSDLLRGDLTALYLAWLHGAAREFDPEEDEAPVEPPVPPGLRALSAPYQALCRFLDVDETLVAAAAEHSEKAEPEDLSRRIQAWLRKVPVADKERWILRLVTGASSGLEGEVLGRFREEQRPAKRGAASPARTLAKILERAEVLKEQQKRREKEASARARAARARAEAKAQAERLDALAEDEAGAWQAVEDHVTSKSHRYAEAVALLDDLRALAERSGTLASFEAQLLALQARHATKPALLRRLREKMPPGKP